MNGGSNSSGGLLEGAEQVGDEVDPIIEVGPVDGPQIAQVVSGRVDQFQHFGAQLHEGDGPQGWRKPDAGVLAQTHLSPIAIPAKIDIR